MTNTNNKTHLNIHDRFKIENGLNNKLSFKAIAKIVNKNCTTISREIRNHIKYVKKGGYGKVFNDCVNRFTCTYTQVCNKDNCFKDCRHCKLCTIFCNDYIKQECTLLNKPPYVCNGCKKKNNCSLEKRYYYSTYADKQYKDSLVNCRVGVNMLVKELNFINDLVKPHIDKGQSLHHIYASNKDSLTVCERSLYNYVNKGIVDIKRIDMPRSVKFKARKKNKSRKVDTLCRDNRTFKDYLKFIKDNNVPNTVEMDTVEGIKGGKALLTIHFVNCSFMLAFIRDRNDSKSVIDIFNNLYNKLTHSLFTKLFPVILTDNGSEFTNPTAIEFSNNLKRTNIFYCDPYCSYQKGACENNHTLFRRILPKGSSFDNLNQDDIDLCVNHVNSYLRKNLNDNSPYNLFNVLYGEQTLSILGVKHIKPNDVVLNPTILK